MPLRKPRICVSPRHTCLPFGVLWPVDAGSCHCWPVVCGWWLIPNNKSSKIVHHDVSTRRCASDCPKRPPTSRGMPLRSSPMSMWVKSNLLRPVPRTNDAHSRITPSSAYDGDNDHVVLPLVTMTRVARGLDRFDGRPEIRGRRGRNDPTINRMDYEKSKTHCQVVRGRLWHCSRPFLLLWAPLIDRPGNATIDDGVEANETIRRSNNQPWGVVEKEGDDCGVVLLEVVCPENTTMNNCWWTTQQSWRGETTIQQPR